jgi:hypothetical protein
MCTHIHVCSKHFMYVYRVPVHIIEACAVYIN